MKTCALLLATLTLIPALPVRAQTPTPTDIPVLEAYPDELLARIETRDSELRNSLPATIGGDAYAYVIGNLSRWTPGKAISVGFQGGNDQLRRDIVDVASEWSQYGNVRFSFHTDAAGTTFRNWSSADASYAAEIRISFDRPGYWSCVGTDSITPTIAPPNLPSMNFGNFHLTRPANWKAVVLHEFGHAIGFHHEHQHPLGTCESDFRWEDDPDYQMTRDVHGAFVNDANGRRPGLYTMLAGFPNYWPRYKVDWNLRQLSGSASMLMGPFDVTSIMKYSFPAGMFREGQNSHCFSAENETLSQGDKQGVAEAYPTDPVKIKLLVDANRRALAEILLVKDLPAKFDIQFKKLMKTFPQ